MEEFPKSPGSVLRVLELGAGTGEQARLLEQKGYAVTAIDMPDSAYSHQRIFPMHDYDGVKIPFPQDSFDIVFSSNVLEHVVKIDVILDEISRVLVPSGYAIHILPTASCRFFGILSHYMWVLRRTFAFFGRSSKAEMPPPVVPKTRHDLLITIFPFRHGERGNTITEMFYFSEWYWKKMFKKHGFIISKIRPTHLFYTMAGGLEQHLTIKQRQILSAVLGSACSIYVLKNNDNITKQDI